MKVKENMGGYLFISIADAEQFFILVPFLVNISRGGFLCMNIVSRVRLVFAINRTFTCSAADH